MERVPSHRTLQPKQVLGARSGLGHSFGTWLQDSPGALDWLHSFVILEKLVQQALALSWLLMGEREFLELSGRLRILR